MTGKKISRGAAVALCLLAGLLAHGQQPVAPAATTAAPLPAAGLETMLRRVMQERRIPGLQVAVVQHGRVALLQSYGWANLQDSIPVTNQSIFAINSCTKAFTGVAVMQLVEAGKVALTAPVSRYLDGLPAAWQPVTIRQLLTHVSGLPDVLRVLSPGTGGLAGLGSEAAAWAKVQALPMDFVTGEQFSYNQTNYLLLGKIIDKLSGQPFAQVFSERQFRVAAMPRTVFADSREVIPHLAPTYKYETSLDGQKFSEGKLTNSYAEFPPSRRTASGLNSTAEDVAHWLIALQQGRLLSTKTALNTLWTAGTYNNGTPTQWALGWVAKPRARHRAVIATGGGRSAFFVYPQDDLAVVVLTNLAGAYPEDFIDEAAGYFNPEIPASDPITALRMQLQKRGFDQASAVFKELKKKDKSFAPSEVDLNDWAYRMMANRQLKEALAVFKLTLELYPRSWNAYDSYGEALVKSGQPEQATAMYQKSVELNPDNQNGKRILEQLLK
ncbi:serine hydrolase [Hymenobacter terricola]|uniref:serine hydrolase n=1 Tax=Hymenobacter terricola TaxID=2819236 RepID=UPI001B3075FC|nr:serine hydrolase [Hymenobacter terricola]